VKRPSIELVEQMLRDAINADIRSEIDRLAYLLDELTPPKQPPSLLSAALWYAENGLRVFPVMPRSKQPYPRSRGCHDATDEITRVRAWWEERPDANIGIATGFVVDVIDIDGLQGNISLARDLLVDPTMEDPYNGLPVVFGSVATPRPGGRHLYIAADESKRNRAGMRPGIDYRGRGGYVVAPPSVTEIGAYRWTRALDVEGARQHITRG
jgi:bifunctional DNA primase/polymerase-like protein